MRSPFNFTLCILLLLTLSNVAQSWYAKVYFDDTEESENSDEEEESDTSEYNEDIAFIMKPLESIANEVKQNSSSVYYQATSSLPAIMDIASITASSVPSLETNSSATQNYPPPTPKPTTITPQSTQTGSSTSFYLALPSIHNEPNQPNYSALVSPGIPLHNGYNKNNYPTPTSSSSASSQHFPGYPPNILPQEQRNIDIPRPSITHNSKSSADILLNALTKTNLHLLFGTVVLTIYLA